MDFVERMNEFFRKVDSIEDRDEATRRMRECRSLQRRGDVPRAERLDLRYGTRTDICPGFFHPCEWLGLSQIDYLGDDGLALGFYELFDTDDTSLGNRAFAFTVEDGMMDLGSLIDGGLGAAGWTYLADAFRANGSGQIIGAGLLSDMTSGQMTYLLTPVPVPPALYLFGTGLLGLIGVARKKAA